MSSPETDFQFSNWDMLVTLSKVIKTGVAIWHNALKRFPWSDYELPGSLLFCSLKIWRWYIKLIGGLRDLLTQEKKERPLPKHGVQGMR